MKIELSTSLSIIILSLILLGSFGCEQARENRESDFYKIAKLLIDNGADVNAIGDFGRTPLLGLASQGKSEDSRYPSHYWNKGDNGYTDCGEDDNCTSLLKATSEKRTEDALYLIDIGEDVNAKNKEETTPLECAAYWGDLELVKRLLEKGAKVNPIKSKTSDSPLHCVASCGQIGIAKLLIDNGATLDSSDYNGMLSIHLAAFESNIELAKVIIENGGDVNARTKTSTYGSFPSWTPLHMTAAKCLSPFNVAKKYSKDFVMFLLNNGADVNAKDNEGRTPLDIALNGDNIEIAKILTENGAVRNIKDN